MDTATINNSSELSARVLTDLKEQLSRLRSYTAELGEARTSAVDSLRAASEALRLVDQLGELQRTQISELKLGCDATLDAHRQGLVDVTEAWGQHWLSEATKALTILDTIVGRQHQLAQEITEFQEAMRNASGFADAQQALETQVVHLTEVIHQSAEGARASLENAAQTIAREVAQLSTKMQQTGAEQTQAVAGLIAAVHQGIESSETGATLLSGKISALDASVGRFDVRSSEHTRYLEQFLVEMRDERVAAREDASRIAAELLAAQSNFQDEVRQTMLDVRAGTRRWNIITVVAVSGILLAFVLLRYL